MEPKAPQSATKIVPTTKTVVDPTKAGKSKGWKWFFGILGGCGFLTLGCGVCFYLMMSAQGVSSLYDSAETFTPTVVQGTGEDKVAIIDVSGFMSDFSGSYSLTGSAVSSADEIVDTIDYAVDTQNADAILFRLNTPGGSFTSAETICQKINEVRDEGVYTMAWIHTSGASGGYYIASCTDWIIAREDSLTGSVGVYIEYIDVNAFLEHIGFRVRTVANTEGVYKTGEEIFEEGSASDIMMTELLDESYDRFIDVIVAGRKGKGKSLTRAEIISLSDGRVYSGKQAYANGLVDANGFEKDAYNSIIARADLGADATFIEISAETGFWDQLSSSALLKLGTPVIDVESPGMKVMSVMK